MPPLALPGRPVAHVLTAEQVLALAERIRVHVTAAARSDLVLGYYVLDDYWADFTDMLPRIHRIIARADPGKPTLCALAVPLAVRGSGQTTFTAPSAVFERALVNYSPRWCDSPVLYSYAPISRSPRAVSVGWGMTQSLPGALAELRRRGWNAARQPLIGVPQAFGYEPMRSRNGRKAGPVYVPRPTASNLRLQSAAFCRYGASALIAYAWNDRSVGQVAMLSNTPSLRAGLRAGIDDCRRLRWG